MRKPLFLGFPILYLAAGDRTRTGTKLPSRDFKSLASANSATPAYYILKRKRVSLMKLLFITYECISDSKRSGAYRARTYDPLLVRQMLSQLS